MFNLFKKKNQIGKVFPSLKAEEICECGRVLVHKRYLEVAEGEISFDMDKLNLDGKMLVTMSLCDKCSNIFLRRRERI